MTDDEYEYANRYRAVLRGGLEKWWEIMNTLSRQPDGKGNLGRGTLRQIHGDCHLCDFLVDKYGRADQRYPDAKVCEKCVLGKRYLCYHTRHGHKGCSLWRIEAADKAEERANCARVIYCALKEEEHIVALKVIEEANRRAKNECTSQIKLAVTTAVRWYCGVCVNNGSSCEGCRVYDMGVQAGINEPIGETNEPD